MCTRRNDDWEECLSINGCRGPAAVHRSQASVGTLLRQNFNHFARAGPVSVRSWAYVYRSDAGDLTAVGSEPGAALGHHQTGSNADCQKFLHLSPTDSARLFRSRCNPVSESVSCHPSPYLL